MDLNGSAFENRDLDVSFEPYNTFWLLLLLSVQALEVGSTSFFWKKNPNPTTQKFGFSPKIQNSKNRSKMITSQNWDIREVSKESLDSKYCLKAKKRLFPDFAKCL